MSFSCNSCHKVFQQLRSLTCQHAYCRQCISRQMNEFVLKSGQAGNPNYRPGRLCCEICSELTQVPDCDVNNLPLHKITADKVETGHAAAQRGQLSNVASVSAQVEGAMAQLDIGWESLATRKIHPRLIYKSEGKYVIDVAFLADRSVVFIQLEGLNTDTHIYETAHLGMLDAQGKETDLPFPTFIVGPRGLGSSQDGHSLVIIDRQEDGTSSVITYTQIGSVWHCEDFTIDYGRFVTISSSKDIIIGGESDQRKITRYSSRGAIKWVKYQPGGRKWTINVAVDDKDNVIVSDSNTYEVYVLEAKGKQIAKINPIFLNEPEGVCVTTDGYILVGDEATNVISLFNIDGAFVRKIAKVDGKPTFIDILQDKYLVVGSLYGDIVMYEL